MRKSFKHLVISTFAICCFSMTSCCSNSCDATNSTKSEGPEVVVGALKFSEYLPIIEGKKVSILSNQTGMVSENTHLLDTLLAMKVNVVSIMSPEHGFRGDADAGEHVASSVDAKTGIPIRSLYERGVDGPSDDAMNEFDVMIFDLQDVGVRFYTYNATMARMMNSCAKYGKKMIVLDRPNPLGFYVDGPILDMKFKSGVGWLPIPIVHGMTLGELAMMINGEGWLPEDRKCDLTVVTCDNYTHQTMYQLPVKPSPNLPDMRSIYLYPSTCFFEATPVSLGRGTDKAFQMYGHPNMKGYSYSFTPKSVPGAKFPPQLNKKCYGVDLTKAPSIAEINKDGVNLDYVVDAYNNLNLDDHFFRSFFELLVGRDYIRKMIKKGKTADEIEAMWVEDVETFKKQRAPYLLYEE